METPLQQIESRVNIAQGVRLLAIVIRRRLEDQILQRGLPGYKEYAGTVRYRLLPG